MPKRGPWCVKLHSLTADTPAGCVTYHSLKHLSHIHRLHPGPSRILIRGPPACNTTILSQCRCEYVANWAFIRNSTVSTRKDKAATRTSPERPRSEPGLHEWARKQLGVYTVFLRTCTFFTGITPECWRCVEKRWPKLVIGHSLCYI